jgi:stringent starvation protein B
MLDAKDSTSTRPYLIRALYEWCTDNGYTPFIAVLVNDNVRVPVEFVKDGEIVLNISFDATSALNIGNDHIEFKGRFGGVARDIYVPVSQVLAIYARENGQGMAFPRGVVASGTEATVQPPQPMPLKLTPSISPVASAPDGIQSDDLPPGSKTKAGAAKKPALTRIK